MLNKNSCNIVLSVALFGSFASAISPSKSQESDIQNDNRDSVQVSCDEQKGNCWSTLAQSLKENPNARHFTVQSEYHWSDSLPSGEFDCYMKRKWFFNSRYQTVDYLESSFSINGAGDSRPLYKKITQELLLKFLNESDGQAQEDKEFDEFARRNGVIIISKPIYEWKKTPRAKS